MGMRRLAVAIVGAAACAASAQTMTYFWTVTTDDGDTDVTPGETAYLLLWAHMDPQAVGFAGSIFDVLGGPNWDTGEITCYGSLLDVIGDMDGRLQANNDILSIECFQLPPLFNPYFADDNPIATYEICWSTDDYSPRVVEVGDANHRNNDVYTDTWGTTESYEGIPGVARFTVNVPAPPALAVLGIAALRRARR